PGRRLSRPVAQETLHRTILEAVEAHHRQPAACAKRAFGGAQPGVQLVQLAIEVDADRLEGTGRGVARLVRAIAGGAAHDLGKRAGALARAGSDDGAGDAAGARLLAIEEDDVSDLRLVGAVQEIGRALAFLRHAHVGGTIVLETEAALRPVEL